LNSENILKANSDSLKKVNRKISIRYFCHDIGIRLQSKNDKPPIQVKSKGQIGAIHYYGKNALKILDWIYNGSNDTNRLKRKYELYLKYKNNEFTR